MTKIMKCDPKFYNEFKPIRNKLRAYRKDQIIITCFENLKKTWNYNVLELVDKGQPVPWHTMLIFKWGMVYGANKFDGGNFSQKEFGKIYDLIKELPSNARWLDSGDTFDVWRWMRANFAGQLPYQVSTGFYGLAVIEMILKDIGINYNVDEVLIELVGLNLEEFIDFQSLITSIYVEKDTYPQYSMNFFRTFSDKSKSNKMNNFLRFISMGFEELENFLTDHHNSISNPEFEYNLPSPLSEKPLYRFNDSYVAYNKTLLNKFCEYGLYDLLKSNNSEKFSSAFGEGFETYLTYSLDGLKSVYHREKEIKREFSVSNSVDFLISNKNEVLLIEAKSAEISELTRLNPEMKYLEQTFQNSLIKGYKQIFLTAFELKKQNPKLFGKSNFWALIVTYKDFMFGAPETIWLEFMQTKMKNILPEEVFSNLPIDPLKIFVASVYEFDSLCLFTKRKDSTLFNSLAIAFDNNKESITKKFSFILHYSQEKIKVNDFDQTKDKLDEIMKRIKNYLE